MYSREFIERAVSWNGVTIYLANMSAEWDIHVCSVSENVLLKSIWTGSFIALRGYKVQSFLIEVNFMEHLSVTVSGSSWQPAEALQGL